MPDGTVLVAQGGGAREGAEVRRTFAICRKIGKLGKRPAPARTPSSSIELKRRKHLSNEVLHKSISLRTACVIGGTIDLRNVIVCHARVSILRQTKNEISAFARSRKSGYSRSRRRRRGGTDRSATRSMPTLKLILFMEYSWYSSNFVPEHFRRTAYYH